MTVELKAAFSERTYLAEKLLFIHGSSGTFSEKYTVSCIFLSALTKNDHFTVGY